jgi:acetoin utilization deacetylase AcuC-like enzyme
MQSAIVADSAFIKHDPGNGHPERPERIKVLLDLASGLDAAKFKILTPVPAQRTEIELCHAAKYIELIEATSQKNRYALDGDTITSRDSFAVALLAVGGFLRLLDSIAARESRNGFAFVRPPGHHALNNRAMGFCLFNTIAIGAEYLKRTYGVSRVLILDWDVHHGNGTQDTFYDDRSVLFISTHQFPFYPGTGSINEVGVDDGLGYTVNVPLPAGCGDAEYLRIFRDVVIPSINQFAPEWILVSAGFDAHRRDPLAGMNVTEEGFTTMARLVIDRAEEFCEGRVAFLLEGGYDLTALKNSAAGVLQAMQQIDRTEPIARLGGISIDPLVGKILQVHEQVRADRH